MKTLITFLLCFPVLVLSQNRLLKMGEETRPANTVGQPQVSYGTPCSWEIKRHTYNKFIEVLIPDLDPKIQMKKIKVIPIPRREDLPKAVTCIDTSIGAYEVQGFFIVEDLDCGEIFKQSFRAMVQLSEDKTNLAILKVEYNSKVLEPCKY